MKKQRYILENVPEGQQGQVHKVLQGEWHGVWLDANTLFVNASMDVHEMELLANHPDCQVLSSPLDPTPAQQQAAAFEEKKAKKSKGNAKVPDYFSKHGVLDTDNVGQAGLKIAQKLKNPHLEP